jgi:hypothetical protein
MAKASFRKSAKKLTGKSKSKFSGLNYRSFKLQKKIKRDSSDIPSSWRLIGRTYQTLVKHWKMFGAIALIYGAIYLFFIRVAPDTSLQEYSDLLDEFTGAESSGVLKTFTLAGIALSSSGAATDAARLLYANIMFVVVSLVAIWTLRHLFANKKFNVRDTFYKSMTPLIPFLLIILLMLIQFIPFAIGGLLYSIVKFNNITISGGEDLIFLSLWGGLGLLSGYWLANTLMAMYAVTLPGMYPMAALRATKELVRHRRWFVLRKIIMLAVVAFSLFFLVLLFVITINSGLTYWWIDIAIILAPLVVHTYLYHLYRSLV